LAPVSPAESELIAIGRIGPAHGTRGDVFVEPWTDLPVERFAVGAVLATEPPSAGPVTVESFRLHNGKVVLHFAGFDDRYGVGALRGVQLLIAAADRPPLDDPEEFYDTDLIGLLARSADGVVFGPIREVVHIGPADYLMLEVDGVERLVPFVASIVPVVDVVGGFVRINPPTGLFEL
jgi:16S rRNA processing protein RimM